MKNQATESTTPPSDTAESTTSQSSTADKTTFSTWGRVAADQLDSMSGVFAKAAKFQGAALEQGKELLNFNLKLANDWQAWASETGNSLRSALFPRK